MSVYHKHSMLHQLLSQGQQQRPLCPPSPVMYSSRVFIRPRRRPLVTGQPVSIHSPSRPLSTHLSNRHLLTSTIKCLTVEDLLPWTLQTLWRPLAPTKHRLNSQPHRNIHHLLMVCLLFKRHPVLFFCYQTRWLTLLHWTSCHRQHRRHNNWNPLRLPHQSQNHWTSWIHFQFHLLFTVLRPLLQKLAPRRKSPQIRSCCTVNSRQRRTESCTS